MVYFKRLRSSGFVSLEAFKMYYVMRTFAPSLHRKSTDFLINISKLNWGIITLLHLKWWSYIMKHIVLVTVIYSVTADANHSCPLWHYHHQGKCKCGDSLNGAILCSDGNVFLRTDYVMWQNTTFAAPGWYVYHNYSAIPRNLRVCSAIPADTPPEELNRIMCNESNRIGFVCGKCCPTFGPNIKSFNSHKCHLPLSSAIALYLTVKLLPTTVLFIIIMMFRINIFRGPMLGCILFCQEQVIIQALNVNESFIEACFTELNHYNI